MHRTVLPVILLSLGAVLFGSQAAAGQDSRVASAPVVRQWIATAGRLQATGRRADSDSAVTLLRRVVAADPQHAQALELLALTYAARIERYGLPVAGYDTAAVLVARIMRRQPAHGYYLLGRIYSSKGENAFAVDALQRAVQYDSTHLLARLWLGSRYVHEGRPDLALPLLLRAAQVMPQNTMARDLAATAYFHLGHADQAELQFRRSLALRPSTYNAGGLLLTRLLKREYPAAIAISAESLRADTTSARGWAQLGEAYFFAGNHGEAERVLAGALLRDSSTTNSYTSKSAALPLAFLYRRGEREEEAAQLMARSYARADSLLRRGQEPWNAHYQYAALALIEGDRGKALRWLRSALEAGMPGPLLLETDPLLADLRGDAQFEDVLQRLRWRENELRRRLGLQP